MEKVQYNADITWGRGERRIRNAKTARGQNEEDLLRGVNVTKLTVCAGSANSRLQFRVGEYIKYRAKEERIATGV